ncbi:tail fiber protein [Seohaeicola saemankumensis]|uniref:phage tail protein n=1 Tax=Seohaeicola saemankumensis TaxID=481181 RepID=UPI003AF340A1|nr:tail fiber protein [Seohaeicola saemankumensis]
MPIITGDPILPENFRGMIFPYAGAAAPAGFLLCDGAAVSRTTYAGLFSLIGTAYGAGDGSTTFNVPDLKGRVPVGYDAAQTEFDALGKEGGEKTHTLTTDEIPAHSHNIGLGNDSSSSGSTPEGRPASAPTNTASTAPAGGGLAHNNIQPYTTVNFIIKT